MDTSPDTSSRTPRPVRVRMQPKRWIEACAATDDTTAEKIQMPKNYVQARSQPDWKYWKLAMEKNLRKYMDMDPPAIKIVKVKDLRPMNVFWPLILFITIFTEFLIEFFLVDLTLSDC